MNELVSKKISKFFSTYKLRDIKKGEILIQGNTNPEHIFYLVEGLVKMYVISKNGNIIVLNIFKSGAFFPISLLVNDSPNPYYYESLTPVKIKATPNEKVLKFLKSNPDVLFDLLQRLYKGIDGLLLKLTFAMSSSARTRLITELITEAKRFGKTENKYYELDISINDLATTVGLARETVSREIKQLRNEKIISVKRRKIIIFSLKRLENEIY